jgi:hypothetical protein
MAMLDLFDDGCEFAAQSLVQADPKDLADAVRRQPPEARARQEIPNGELAFLDSSWLRGYGGTGFSAALA